MNIETIGNVVKKDGEMAVQLLPKYKEALIGIEGFQYLQILWWFDQCDNDDSRGILVENKPYTNGPEKMGVFATRSPNRPNPIALSTVYVTHIDLEDGMIYVAYLDGNEGSPVLDIKPYTPSIDRVENPHVPEWCAHWPKCNEESGFFDWEKEFNF